MRILIPRLLLIASVFLMLTEQTAFSEDKAKAVKLLAVGDDALAAGDRFSRARIRRVRRKAPAAYKRALRAYLQARENYPSPKIFFPIALTQEKLGRYLESHDNYLRFLKETEEPGEELTERANKGIAALRERLAGIDLKVPAGATVQIDETDVVVGAEPKFFEPGTYTIVVELKGYETYSKELTLEEGVVLSHSAELEKIKAAPPKKVEKVDPVVVQKPREAGGPSRLPVELSFAAAGALALSTTFAVVLATSKKDISEDESLSDSVRDKAKKRSDTYFLVSGALLGGVVLASGYGLIHYYTSYRPAQRKHEKSALQVLPTANDEGLGFAVLGRF